MRSIDAAGLGKYGNMGMGWDGKGDVTTHTHPRAFDETRRVRGCGISFVLK